MISLPGQDANHLYVAAAQAVVTSGRPSSPRGNTTTEVLGAHLHLRNPRCRLVDVPPVRVLNPAFAVAEFLWILSGSDDPWIFLFNSRLKRYTDGGRLQGAYGPRMRNWHGRVDQLDQARQRLVEDPDSRQAVIQLFDPDRDYRGYRDVPCTLGYRFFIRDSKLHMHTTMRSQDLWLGLPYDLFVATLLQELMAGWLDVDLGGYHHFVDSLHVYDEHRELAVSLSSEVSASFGMDPISVPWASLRDVSERVVAGESVEDMGAAWATFSAVMASYRLWVDGERAGALEVVQGSPSELARALERWYQRLGVGEAAGTGSKPSTATG